MAVEKKPCEFLVADEVLIGGKVKLHHHQGVPRFRISYEGTSSQFFLATRRAVDKKGAKRSFSRQNLGRNTLCRITRDKCSDAGVRGDGPHSVVNTHGLRATCQSSGINTEDNWCLSQNNSRILE